MEHYKASSEPSTSGLIPLPLMKPLEYDNKRSLDENEEQGPEEPSASKMAKIDNENRKIYIGNLPPSVTEKALVAHFRTFGHVINCQVIRDKETGISKGFAFLTFLDDSEAETAIEYQNHTLDGKPIRVSAAQKNASATFSKNQRSQDRAVRMDSVTIPRTQVRVYLGPLDDDVQNPDITAQLTQFGVIRGVSKLKSSVSSVKRSFAFVDYQDPISVRRTFTNKIFIKGKFVKVTLSKLAMELILSKTVVFFYEAHEYCDKQKLEQHFKQYGQVYRAFQFLEEDMQRPKSYGFVDFLGDDSVPRAVTTKQQLINEQFVRVSKFLPINILHDLMCTSDKHANAMIRKIEQTVPNQGSWGALPKSNEKQDEVTTSQVRIPSAMVPRLIGERGKNITEISRDSKTKITIPKVTSGEESKATVITITGTKMNIKTAQYLMQKLLKPAK